MNCNELDVVGSAGPLIAAVTHPRYIARFPGSEEELWFAHVRVSREGGFNQDFSSILFVEGAGLASIYGIASPDGYPVGLARHLALQQQSFITFLRHENACAEGLFGPALRIFTTHLYYSELMVTKAYLAARGSSLYAGVGYNDPYAGVYVTQVIEVEHATGTEASSV